MMMKVELLNSITFPEEELKSFMSSYRFEDFYLKTLKPDIDLSDFIKFKINRIRSGVENGRKIWLVRDDSKQIIAVFGLYRNNARSRNFGMEYYELNPVFNFSDVAVEALACFEQEVLNNEVETLKIDYIKGKINASDHQNIAAFSTANYAFFATSLNLYLPKERYQLSQNPDNETEIIPFKDQYIEAVRDILLQHDHSEDYYDPVINSQKTQNNFYDWLFNYYLTEKARARYQTEIILLFHKKDNRIAGFTCYTKEPNFSKRFNLQLITRDLTIIPKEYHNRGYGSILFSEIMKRENKNVELKLMSNNYKAIGFNHHNGFKCVNSAHFFRKIFKHDFSFR